MNWIPYPKNMPQENKEYLVSRNGFVTLAIFSTHHKFYNEETGNYYAPAWVDDNLGGVHIDVTAFMEKPKPFERG